MEPTEKFHIEDPSVQAALNNPAAFQAYKWGCLDGMKWSRDLRNLTPKQLDKLLKKLDEKNDSRTTSKRN